MLASETIASRHDGAACIDCQIVPQLVVSHSAAGHMIATSCGCPGPFTRESDYHPSAAQAARALVRGVLGELPGPERIALVARLGLDGGRRDRPPEEVARQIGTRPEWVGRFGDRAEAHLRMGVAAGLIATCEAHPAARLEARAILEGSAEPLDRARARAVWREGGRYGSPATIPAGMSGLPGRPHRTLFGADALALAPPYRGLSLVDSPDRQPPGPSLDVA